jgi:hypothetical protein
MSYGIKQLTRQKLTNHNQHNFACWWDEYATEVK